MAENKTVLVADDDPIVVERIREVLGELGCRVIGHDDGLGLSAVILRERPDVVLVDVMMPRLSGDQIVTLIKENNLFEDLKLTFIFFSSKDEASLLELVRQSGAEGAIQKSVSDEQLQEQFLSLTAW